MNTPNVEWMVNKDGDTVYAVSHSSAILCGENHDKTLDEVLLENDEAWQEKIEDIKTSISKVFSVKGWYKVATGISASGELFISLRNLYGRIGSDATTLLYQCTVATSTYNNAKVTLVSSSSANNKIFTDVRVVRTADEASLEVFYNADADNTCQFGLLRLYPAGDWKVCDPILVEETPEETDVVIAYNIPKNAQPMLNTDKPTGTYTGNGDAKPRTINIGGVGSTLVIYGYGMANVTAGGGFYKIGTTITGLDDSEAKLDPDNMDFVLAMSDRLNVDGVTYRWYLL